MEKEKLIELSKQYFDNNKDLQEIIACSDGNFFYEEPYADYHRAKNDLQKHIIKRSDLVKPEVKTKTEREFMFEEAVLLNIDHPKNIKNIKLKGLIEAKKLESKKDDK